MLFPKILCILAATLGLHTASTSPNPPLLDAKRPIATTGWEFILASHLLRRSQTCIYWLVAIAETACLLAQFAPSSFWAQRILATLTFGGALRLSASPTVVLGALLIVCGSIVRLWCYHALGSHFTFETGIFKNHKLVTTGPYNLVRHPSYSGAFLAFAGMVLYYGSPGSWVMECMMKTRLGMVFVAGYALTMMVVVTGLAGRIPNEDEALRTEFGKAWEDWAVDRCALVPGVY